MGLCFRVESSIGCILNCDRVMVIFIVILLGICWIWFGIFELMCIIEEECLIMFYSIELM